MDNKIKIIGEKSEDWSGKQLEAQSDPLIDPGTGKAHIIRQFEFAFNPETAKLIRQKKIAPPTQQQIFNSHWDQIRKMLWADGLVAIQEPELPPRMVIGKKRYKIFILCQPRQGVMVNEKIRNLQEVMNPKSP